MTLLVLNNWILILFPHVHSPRAGPVMIDSDNQRRPLTCCKNVNPGLRFLSFISLFPPYPSLSFPLSLFLPFSGRWHKMTHKGWHVVKPQHNKEKKKVLANLVYVPSPVLYALSEVIWKCGQKMTVITSVLGLGWAKIWGKCKERFLKNEHNVII